MSKPKSEAERSRSSYHSRKDQGLMPRRVWVHESRIEEFRKFLQRKKFDQERAR